MSLFYVVFVHGQVNTIPLHDTMCMAMRVMENIEATIIPIQLKVPKQTYEYGIYIYIYDPAVSWLSMHACMKQITNSGKILSNHIYRWREYVT